MVGIVSDMRQTSLAEEPDAEYYLPYAEYPNPSMVLVIRTYSDPLRLAPTVHAAVRELDKELPVSDIGDLAHPVSGSTYTRRLTTTLLGVFATLSLLLAALVS